MIALGLSTKMDYQQRRWHVEIRATLVPSLKAWGGSGDRMEDAFNEAVCEMVKDLGIGSLLDDGPEISQRLVER